MTQAIAALQLWRHSGQKRQWSVLSFDTGVEIEIVDKNLVVRKTNQ